MKNTITRTLADAFLIYAERAIEAGVDPRTVTREVCTAGVALVLRHVPGDEAIDLLGGLVDCAREAVAEAAQITGRTDA